MRVAIIDLGTNSVRFDVHQIGPKNRVRQLHREKLMVRLGQGVFTEGKLNADAIRRTLQAFASFKRTSRELRVDRMIAFGTAALREAADGARLLKSIRARTGIELRVISGVEESKLIALGILARETLPKGRFGLIDIGGGSTEISICRGKKILHGDSFPLGTARLQQVFLRSSPPKAPPKSDEDPVEHLRKYIRHTIHAKTLTEGWPKVDRLIGSSGTVRALCRLVHKNPKKKSMDRGELKKLVQRMATMTTTELLSLHGMEAKRVDMILAGAILLEEAMNAVGAKKVAATEYSLRDGILEEQINLVKNQQKSTLGLHLGEVRTRVSQVRKNMSHTDRVVRLCETLFDQLAPVHRLKPEWRSILLTAAYLHDLGEIVSPTNHEKHSYYIVKNGDYPLEKWEAEFVGRLCLYHRSGKPELPELGRNEKEKREAFYKLLSLLRVAAALDLGHDTGMRIRKVRVQAKKIVLSLETRNTPDLELLRVEQKKGLFEDTFKRPLVLEFKSTK